MKKRKIYIFILTVASLLIFYTACTISEDFTETAYEEKINNQTTVPETSESSNQTGYDITLPGNYPAYARKIPFPFLLDEIKSIFNENKELFEKVKNIGAEFGENHGFSYDGLRECDECPYIIHIRDNDSLQNEEIYENSKYEPIIEIFNYTDFSGTYHGGFRGIYLYNNLDYPEFGKYLDFVTNSPFFVYIRYYYDYEPEEITENGDLHIKLEDNWYYCYTNQIRPPT